jgi:hypothetical protein
VRGMEWAKIVEPNLGNDAVALRSADLGGSTALQVRSCLRHSQI